MYMSLFTETGDLIRFLVLVALTAVVGGYLLYLNRRTEAEKPTAFAHLNENTLADIPDDKLVSAVIENLLAKLDKKKPQPYLTIPPLGEARCTVYCAWAYDKLLRANGFAALRNSRDAALFTFAIDAFRALGAEECANIVESAFSAPQNTDFSELDAAFIAASEKEQPLLACIPYIRDNAPLFCDCDE